MLRSIEMVLVFSNVIARGNQLNWEWDIHDLVNNGSYQTWNETDMNYWKEIFDQ